MNRFLVKFDLSSIPSNATVDSSTLSLYLASCSGTPFPDWLVAGRASSSWTESGVTWNNKPGYLTNVRQYIPCSSGWKDFNVKTIVSEWVSGSKANYGFMVLGDEDDNTWYRTFYSRGVADYKPKLVINYTVPDTTGPTISNIVVSEITKTGAKVTWTTNEASSSYVEYGPTSSYGTTYGAINLVTNHSILLPNLSAGQTYHFRVRSKDAANNEAASTDNTFTTASESSPGTSTVTSPVTSPETSPTVGTKEATSSATSITKKGGTSTTSAAGQGKSKESKIAGIKTPIFIIALLLILLAAGVAVYVIKFRHGLLFKKTPNIQVHKFVEPQPPKTPENKNPL